MILPELLDANLHPVRRIQPIKASVRLNLTPLSTAELDLYPGDTIPARSLVSMYTVQGFAGVFRSSTPNETYGNRATRVHLEHAVAEIGDWIVGSEAEETITTAASAISSLFASYGGTLWTLGQLNCSVNVRFSASKGQNVLEAILGIVSQVPGYMLTLDQTVTPWRLGIALQPETVTAEGRLSRNMQSVQITYDESELCNKVYISGIDTPFEALDSQQKYGVIEHYISESDLPAATAQMVALAYLQAHCDPAISVNISMLDLANLTGEPLDRITLGAKFRLSLPEDGVSIEQHVIGIQFEDVYGVPEAINVTLANEISDTVAYLKKQRRSGRSGQKRAEKLAEEAVQQYQHYATETEVYKQSIYKIIGVRLNENGQVLYQPEYERDPVTGEILIDPDTGKPIIKIDPVTGKPVLARDAAGCLIPVFDENSDGVISSEQTQTASIFRSLYERLGTASLDGQETLVHIASRIEQTADSVSSEVTAARGSALTLSSRITQVAGDITQEVTRATEAEGLLSGRITTEADRIDLVVEKKNGVNVVKRSAIVAAINEDNTSTVTISADKIDINGVLSAPAFQTALAHIDTLVGNLDVAGNVTVGGHLSAGDIDVESFSDYKVDGNSIGLGNAVTGFGTATSTNGQISIPFYTLLNGTDNPDPDNTINFNIADTAFYQSGIGISSATINTTTDNPDVWTDWTNGTHEYPYGTLTQKYALIQVTPNDGDPYYFCIDASSGTGGSASIDDISGTALTPDQILYQTIPIKASGTNVSDYTENATLTNTTYTDNSTTYPCVTLTMDSIVIGRISTQSTYDNGKLVGQNTTRVSKGTWSNGSIVFTTNAPNPAANVPVTLTLTHAIGGWTWTSVDDSGEYQLSAQIKDGTTVVATDNITLPDTKVIVTGPGTQQSSWWKTSGTNAYKYVVPASSASDYLTADTNNEHVLATGNGTQTVIDPTEAVDRGFGICHDSIGLSAATQTLPAGNSVTIYPKAKATAAAESATDITSKGITITAAAASAPKVSKGTWDKGSLVFTAGSTGDDTSTVKIWEGASTGTLDSQTNPTKVSFSVFEDVNGTTVDTGADIYATINATPATLSLGTFDAGENKFTVRRASGGTVNVGGSTAIQTGVTPLDIPVARGTAKPNEPRWNKSAHTYTITADGSFTVGGQSISQTQGFIDGGFAPSDAIEYGKNLAKGIASLTVSQTSQTAWNNATQIPTDTVTSDGYYFVTATPVQGTAVQRKFHVPASDGGGTSDRWARYLNPITLDAGDITTVTKLSLATYSDGEPETDETKKTSVEIDASAVYQAGVTAGLGGVVNVEKTPWSASSATFKPSAGTGSSVTIQVGVEPDVKTASTATNTGTFNLREKKENVTINPVPYRVVLGRTSDGQYINCTAYNWRGGGNHELIARIRINGTPGGEERQIESLSAIKLTESNIGISTQTTDATFDVGDPQAGVSVRVDASEVYNKGLTDGSRYRIEKEHVESQALTRNNYTYTIYPSSGWNAMAKAKFTVQVPTYEGISSAKVNHSDDTASTSWDRKLGNGTLNKKYAEIMVTANDGTTKGYFLDASALYERGVTDGSGGTYHQRSATDIDDITLTSSQTGTSTHRKTVYYDTGANSTLSVTVNAGNVYQKGRSDGMNNIPATAITCSSTVSNIGPNRKNRDNAGSISKSGLTAQSYLGFTIKVQNTVKEFYIAVNP